MRHRLPSGRRPPPARGATGNLPPATRRSVPPHPGERNEYVLSSLTSELGREVVLERELQLDAVAMEAVGEVFAAAPLELAAEHHVGHRGIKKITQRVLAGLERVRRLRVSVVDILAGIADGTAE